MEFMSFLNRPTVRQFRWVAMLAVLISAASIGWPQEAPAQSTKAAAEPATSSNTGATEYVIGEADVLRVTVWKEPELSQAVVVRPDGMISIPLIGIVKASGMTPSGLQDVLTAKLSRFIGKPIVSVTVTEIGSKSVYVTGEVVKPGAYQLVTPMDVLQLIAKAGGVTPYAHRKSVFVLRNVDGKRQKLPVNYKHVLHGENPEQNIPLMPGDTVVVP